MGIEKPVASDHCHGRFCIDRIHCPIYQRTNSVANYGWWRKRMVDDGDLLFANSSDLQCHFALLRIHLRTIQFLLEI